MWMIQLCVWMTIMDVVGRIGGFGGVHGWHGVGQRSLD